MKNIGIAIKRTNQGSGQPTFFNSGEWKNKVVDVRDILKKVKGISSENFLTFMSFSSSGCYITTLRTIGGREGDNVAAWIFIPNGLTISGKELVVLLEKVQTILSSSSIDMEALKEISEKEYDLLKYPYPTRSSSDKKMAVRKFPSEYSLVELLDCGRYQNYYEPYQYILLLDTRVGVSLVSEKSCTDLTHKRMEKYVALIKPSESELLSLFGRTKIELFINDTLMKSAIFVNSQKEYRLTVKRKGFDSLNFLFEAPHKETVCSLPNQDVVEWHKTILANDIKIETTEGNEIPIQDVTILTINGKSIMDQALVLSEEACKMAKVCVKMDGYEDYEQTINLLNAPIVVLNKELGTCKYSVCMTNNHIAEVEIKSPDLAKKYPVEYKGSNKFIKYLFKYIQDQKSPLKAYTIRDVNGNSSKKELVIDTFYNLKQRIIGFIVGLIFTLIIVAIIVAFIN